MSKGFERSHVPQRVDVHRQPRAACSAARLLLAVATVVGALIAALAGPASADPHLSYEDGYPPDLGTSHSYCYHSTITATDDPGLYERIRRAEASLEANTNVNVSKHTPCDNTQPGTDVVWQDQDIISYGQAHCLWRNQPEDLCDHYLATINKSLVERDATDISAQYRKTACHELGHTVTLRHYSGDTPPSPMTRNDCMKQGIWDDLSHNSHTYADHHIKFHINDWFCSGCTAPQPPPPGSPIPALDTMRGAA